MSTPRIIVVEDDEADFYLIERAFNRAAPSCTLAWFKDGEQAAEFLLNPANPLPAIVVSDLKMQRTDGMELLRRLKKNERTKTLPFVMLTSSNLEDDRRNAEKFGAAQYLVKPMVFQSLIELARRVANLAGCGGTGASSN